MRTIEIKENSEISLFGRRHTVMSINSTTVALRRTEGDGAIFEIDYYKLITHPMFSADAQVIQQEKKSEGNTLMDSITEQFKKTISKRFEIIRPVIVLEDYRLRKNVKAKIFFLDNYSDYIKDGEELEKLTQETLLDRISKRQKVHVRTIKRYLAGYRRAEQMESRGEHGLIPDYGKGHLQRKDNYTIEICHPSKKDWVLDVITTRLPLEVHPIIKDIIENEYLKLKKISKKETYRQIEDACLRNGIEKPARSTIYKLLGRIDPKIQDRMREGAKAVREYEPLKRGFTNEEAMFPLHIVAMDHTQLDIDVIDGKTGCEIGRPFITVGIDLYSRCIWSIYISFEDPSANVLRKAMLQGMFLKKAKELNGTQHDWVVHGIPYNIMVDNGKDFRSIEFERVVNEVMKSNLMFRPRRTPHYSGVVERFFKRLNDDLIHQLDGTRKSNVVDKGEYKSEEEAALTLEELQNLITKYVVDVYHYETHQGLPLDENKPMIRFIEGCKDFGLPRFILEKDEQDYRMELLPTFMKPYTQDGVVHNNVSYKSDELNSLIGPRENKYTIKYDPDDISKIHFLHPELQHYIEVFAQNPSADLLAGMNIHVYKALRKKWKAESEEKGKGLPSDSDVASTLSNMKKEYKELYRKNRTARKQAQKMKMQVSIDFEQPKAKGNLRPSANDLLELAKQAASKLI